MKRLIPLFLIAPLLGACGITDVLKNADLSLLQKIEESGGVVDDAVVGNAMKAVPQYCKLPLAARERVRSHVNERPEAGGSKIGVWCVGDPALTLQ